VPWIPLDIALDVLVFLLLAAVSFKLYRHVRALFRGVGQASERVGNAMTGLELQQPDRQKRLPKT